MSSPQSQKYFNTSTKAPITLLSNQKDADPCTSDSLLKPTRLVDSGPGPIGKMDVFDLIKESNTDDRGAKA